MDITMEAEYGGYKIKWRDYERSFRLEMDGVDIKNGLKSLEDCQKWIDQKNKQKYKRVSIIHQFGWGRDSGMKKGEATSIFEGEYVWVVSGKDRTKVKMAEVWIDTPENRKALEIITTKEQEIKTLESEITKIKEATMRLTAEMMVETSEV